MIQVAVVGAGPAGLACANDLALMGYSVTVFEAMEHAGGMLRYGIPAYRLPRDVIDCQVREIEELGVEQERIGRCAQKGCAPCAPCKKRGSFAWFSRGARCASCAPWEIHGERRKRRER